MATRSVKARVEIDGEQKYKQALNELNKGNAVLASEMRKLQAQFRGNEDSTEALTAKGELLERQLLQQKDKVETLRAAMERAAAEYGEADKRTQDWTIKLNNAEAAQFDLEHAIDENNRALEGQGEEVAGIGDSLDDLTGKLSIRLPDAAKKALNSMGSFSSGAVTKLGLVVAIIAAVVKGIQKIDDLTKDAAANADNILTDAQITGLTEKNLQEIKYYQDLVDVSYETITGSMSTLTRKMYDVKQGNASVAQSFAELDVSITDGEGHLRSTVDVFNDVIDALGRQQNATERDALAMELLGKSAQELNPLIMQGTAVRREYAKEAETIGYVLSHDELEALHNVDDAYRRLQLTVEASKKQLALDFAPASEKTFELLSDAAKSAGDILQKSGLTETLGLILSDVLDILQNIIDVTNAIPGLDQHLGILKVTLEAVAQFCALIADATDVITGVLTFDGSKIANAFGAGYNSGNPNNWQRTVMIQDGTYEQYRDFYNSPYYTGYSGANASGNDNWRGGLTWLSENGPETAILPSGTRILSAQDTAMLGGDTYNFTVDVRSLEDLDALIRWAKAQRVTRRMQ